MDRRTFIRGAAGSMLAVSAVASAEVGTAHGTDNLKEEPSVEYYELRRYQLRRGPKVRVVDDYLLIAMLPALQRLGIGPVGVFNVAIGPDSPSMYVLIPHKTFESVGTMASKLAADNEYSKAAAEYLNAQPSDPSFTRMESSLLQAFSGMPKLELPFGGGDAAKRNRIFELRTYESHSEKAGKTKIRMFNEGEIALFRNAGMSPVFFGETIVGAKMPNLTYMLCYEDMAAHDKQWSAFVNDPEWKKLSTTPGYTDAEIVSNISNVYLRPTGYSQI